MKFHSRLTEAVFLKRMMRFLAEIVLPNRQKLIIRCPNINEMKGCDILGTKIWYSTAIGYNCLPTWELAETDGGALVCINPELMKPLIIDAIKQNAIHELRDYNLLHAGGQYDQFRSQFILLEKNKQQCYVGIEQVIVCNSTGEGLFPPAKGVGYDNLHALIQAKEDGHRALLMFCVMHEGVNKVKPDINLDPDYNKLLIKAIACGVEVIAYKTAINLENIELTVQLPVLVSEKEISKFER